MSLPKSRSHDKLFRQIIAFTVIICSLTASWSIAAPRTSAEKAVKIEPTAVQEGQVVFAGQVLFSVKVNSFSFTPVDRASVISERLSRLVTANPARVAAIAVVEGENTSDIVADDMLIMSVSDDDAKAAGVARRKLAEAHAEKVRTTLVSYLNERSSKNLILNGIYALATTIVLLLLLILIKRMYPKVTSRIMAWRGTIIRSLRIQSVEILREDQIVASLLTVVRWARILIVIVLLDLYLTFVLGLFPWTRGVSTKLADYILNPLEKVFDAVVDYLPNIFFIAVIVAISHIFIKLLRLIFGEVGKGTITIPGFYQDWAEPSFKITRFLVIAFAGVVAFPYLPGSSSPAFKGVSVFLGVLVSLGSSSAVANVIAGLILTYMRAFKLGDRVKIADTMGDVIEKNLLVTRIRTIKNVEITIPNAMVLSGHITNFSTSSHDYGLILNTTVTIGYDVPWRNVHELLIRAANTTENILELPAPFVLQTSLNDFYVSYELNAYTDKPAMMARTYSELHQNIQDKFNEAEVEILSPHYTQLRDGNTSTVPESCLKPGYVPGALRVEPVSKE